MNKARGFTIVELLIVIVVIGILAAIVIVAFNGVQQRAKTTQYTTTLNQYIKAISLFTSEKDRYPGYDPSVTGEQIACFNGTSNCHSLANLSRSQALRADLATVAPGLPANLPYNFLITNSNTTDNTNGGATYTGHYLLYEYPGTSCPSLSGVVLLNSGPSGVANVLNCRVRLST